MLPSLPFVSGPFPYPHHFTPCRLVFISCHHTTPMSLPHTSLFLSLSVYLYSMTVFGSIYYLLCYSYYLCSLPIYCCLFSTCSFLFHFKPPQLSSSHFFSCLFALPPPLQVHSFFTSFSFSSHSSPPLMLSSSLLSSSLLPLIPSPTFHVTPPFHLTFPISLTCPFRPVPHPFFPQIHTLILSHYPYLLPHPFLLPLPTPHRYASFNSGGIIINFISRNPQPFRHNFSTERS